MTRRHITAVGTPMITTPHLVGSLHTKCPPMSEARRRSIYGRVQSLRTEAHAAGLMPMRWGVLIILALVAIPATLWAAVF